MWPMRLSSLHSDASLPPGQVGRVRLFQSLPQRWDLGLFLMQSTVTPRVGLTHCGPQAPSSSSTGTVTRSPIDHLWLLPRWQN